ncbi:MAG: ABC transporter permease [Chloroflexota bacterium]
MRNIWTIAKREYQHYFVSPIAYVTAAGLLLFTGGYFAAIVYSSVVQASFYGAGYAPDIGPIISLFSFLLIFVVPALTIRLLADENRSGTIELLLTAPVRDFELVAGKWLGSFLFMLSIIAVTMIYPIILNSLVDPGIDQVVMTTSYLGLILLAAAFIAIGTGISAMFSNQVAAFFVTWIAFLVLWWLIGIPASVSQTGGGEFFRYMTVNSHLEMTFNAGVIKLADILYFLSLTAVGLFAGTMAIETRRWR